MAKSVEELRLFFIKLIQPASKLRGMGDFVLLGFNKPPYSVVRQVSYFDLENMIGIKEGNSIFYQKDKDIP